MSAEELSQGQEETNETATLPFFKRETISLSNEGEVEVFVRDRGEGVYAFSISVRSATEKDEHDTLGEEYFKKYNKDRTNLPITGDGSIEGLLVAYRSLSSLIKELSVNNARELWVEGDERRIDAYRTPLQRLGFIDDFDKKGAPALVFRFPDPLS